MLKKIYVYNENTCTRVKLYGVDITNLFLINGYEKANTLNDANIVIINTCSFLKSKEEYFIKFIKNINDQINEYQQLVIIGCLPSINSKALIKINKNIILFGRNINEIKDYFNFDKDILTRATSVSDKLKFKKQILYLFNKYILHSKHIEYRLKRNKVCYLQISSGCRGKCTYCSEKFTTKLKSRSINEIKDAIIDGYNRGYRLFGLNSDDASAYGKDINCSLEELLTNIIKFDKDVYFSIPEFNPNGISNTVINCLSNKKFLYITVPIQSGSQKILDLMERPYKINEIIEKIKIIKRNNPKIKINTHVIVGFPGETEEDFLKTKKILETGLFDRVKVFMYNERPNTKAVTFNNKVTEYDKIKRRNELLQTVKKSNWKKLSITNLILNKEQLK